MNLMLLCIRIRGSKDERLNRKSMETKVEIEDDGFINAMQKSVKELYKDENSINEVKKLVEE